MFNASIGDAYDFNNNSDSKPPTEIGTKSLRKQKEYTMSLD